jgi:hypothetical protein
MSKQYLLFVKFAPKKPGQWRRAVPTELPTELQGLTRPARVWTLIGQTNPDQVPALPIIPTHNHNAFLEDHIHDWRIQGTKFNYYSRVMDRGTWVLLEYA